MTVYRKVTTPFWSLGVNICIRRDQSNNGCVDQNLTAFFKIDGYPRSDAGLDLADAPIGGVRVAHIHAGNKVAWHQRIVVCVT